MTLQTSSLQSTSCLRFQLDPVGSYGRLMLSMVYGAEGESLRVPQQVLCNHLMMCEFLNTGTDWISVPGMEELKQLSAGGVGTAAVWGVDTLDNVVARVGINEESQVEVKELINKSKVVCANCWLKLDNDLIEFDSF